MPRKATTKSVERQKIGVPDSLDAAMETARCAQEGAYKLQKAVDALRTGLETISVAEFDHEQRIPVSSSQLRAMAVATLDEYSRLVGQNWRKHPLIGNRAGDRNDSDYNESGHGGRA